MTISQVIREIIPDNKWLCFEPKWRILLESGIDIRNYESDDVEFLRKVEIIIRGICTLYKPIEVRIFRIDNWFDSKWLKFAGKVLGAVGIWDNKRVVIPPFVQNRITAQSHFQITPNNQYTYLGEGPNIHTDGPSEENLQNLAKRVAPNSALFWYSGNTLSNGRGSIMGYIPIEKYWGWYLEFAQKNDAWKISKKVNFENWQLESFESDSVKMET